MSVKNLPVRPSLEQYKKQAKQLLRQLNAGEADAVSRVREFHPRGTSAIGLKLADAQLVIAREHGFESWPKFSAEISLRLLRLAAEEHGAVNAFLVAATVPVGGAWHLSGSLDAAETFLNEHPEIAGANIYAAAVLGDVERVRAFIEKDAGLATAKGGPHGWDALTWLCFSRYLREPREGVVECARLLLEAGADAKTGWWEKETGEERDFFEAAIYGTAAIAQHVELTKLLLEFGADPNDEETPYHVPESRDLAVLKVLLESGKLTPNSLTTMLVRKADVHDFEGMKLLLEAGADPNHNTVWKRTPAYQAVQRDNWIGTIELLLQHGADFSIRCEAHGLTAAELAAYRGRADVLRLLNVKFEGVNALIAACTLGDEAEVRKLADESPELVQQVIAFGGYLLAEFAGNGNTEGARLLLELGVSPAATYHGDGYFEIAPGSTALHVAAWKAYPGPVKLLIDRGTPVNALDGQGRSALQLAVKACVDSHWKSRATPETVSHLLAAGASKDGISLPTGDDEIDALLSR